MKRLEQLKKAAQELAYQYKKGVNVRFIEMNMVHVFVGDDEVSAYNKEDSKQLISLFNKHLVA